MGHRGLPRRALLAGSAAGGLGVLAAACSDGTGSSSTTPSSATASGSPASPAAGGSSASPVAAVDHQMAAPGPRQGGLVAHADLLVISGKTITDKAIAAIAEIDGVFDVTVISVSQPVIENQTFTVAAVDPGTYRNYTTQPAADTDAVWQRVADGELALKDQLKASAPLSGDGYLRLGTAKSAPEIHVGAYTPQSPLIDAVVNTSWIPTLGMTPNNAVLIHTAGTAPKKVRKPLEKLLGTDVSVQLVDIATRLGIDPSAQQVAIPTGSVADAVGVYHFNVLGGGAIAPDPDWVSSHIVSATMPIIGTVVGNKVMMPQLEAAFNDVLAQGLGTKIKANEYAGCYVPRFIAGSSTLSNHAFGLAVDLNAIENERGTVGLIDRGVVEIFEHWGFTWGGTWHYTDPMHFEVNTVVQPSSPSSQAPKAAKSALASASAQTVDQ